MRRLPGVVLVAALTAVAVQPFSAQIQAALRTMGLMGEGYSTGQVPVWDATDGRYEPGSAGALLLLSSQTSVAGIGNDANTNEKTLFTYTIPAGTIAANGDQIILETTCQLIASGATKTWRLYFGTTVVNSYATTVSNLATFSRAVIARVTATTQVSGSFYVRGTVPSSLDTQPTMDTAAAIEVKVTGQTSDSVANTVTCRGFWVTLVKVS